MNSLLIGNAISMVGCLIMVLIGFLRKKNQILIAQCVQCLFMGVGNLTLGGISGFICNIVTILRNVVFMRFKNTTFLKVSFVLLQFFLSTALCFVSGCMYPVYFFPVSVQRVAAWLPAGLARSQLASCITGENDVQTLLLLLAYALVFSIVGISARVRAVKEARV